MSRHRPPFFQRQTRRSVLIAGSLGFTLVLGVSAAAACVVGVDSPAPSHAADPVDTVASEAATRATTAAPSSTAPAPEPVALAPTSEEAPAPERAPERAPEPAPEPEPEAPAAPQPVASTASVPAGGIPAGGMFPLIEPGGALPSSEECAARVQRDPWEPRPQNATANATRPTGAFPFGMSSWYTEEADGPNYRGRIDGNFIGTTDEIIQWASCKWGFPTDLSRAQAVRESSWDISTNGDGGESHGLFQMRETTWGGYPNSAASTAFNADWTLGTRRACYEGVTWAAELKGNLEGCIGFHFSGDPDPSTWRAYADRVLNEERNKPWLSWPSATGGTPPTADRN